MSSSSVPGARPRAPYSVAPRGRATASPLWLIVGLAAFVASIACAVIVALSLSTPISLLGITLPLASHTGFWLSLTGYLLSPLGVGAATIGDRIAQSRGLAANRNFVLRPGWSTLLRWLLIPAIALGAWHAVNMSVTISELGGAA